MPQLIDKPTIIQAAGNLSKRIEEFIGRVNSNTAEISIARMTSPPGWEEPGQRPEFTEFTLVLHGVLMVESEDGIQEVTAGQAIIVPAGVWARYRTPDPDGAQYIAVCLPAFSPATVHRDDE